MAWAAWPHRAEAPHEGAPAEHEIRAQGQDVYPVSLAAETAWEAAHGKDVHYMAGKRAKQARFAARFMPGRIKKQIVEGLPDRD